jgi:hypothetical protein
MSIHRILKAARRIGIPVVITNERGESPQVVMSFEDFSSMVRSSGRAFKKPRITDRSDQEEDDEIAQALADITMERMDREADDFSAGDDDDDDLDELDIDELNALSMDMMEEDEHTEEDARTNAPESKPENKDERFLEDHFYFEPLEDLEDKESS